MQHPLLLLEEDPIHVIGTVDVILIWAGGPPSLTESS